MPDYNDLPINKTKEERHKSVLDFRENLAEIIKELNGTGIECIHGHFLPFKYLTGEENFTYVTWLRDPIERVASHYFYWKRSYSTIKAGALHKKVIEEDWTLEKFCFSEEMRNIYSQFLWNFPIEKFSFIGITEHYEEDFNFFVKKFLSINDDIQILQKNVNPEKSTSYFNDPALINELKEFHAEDYKIYNRAKQLRLERS